MKVSKAIEILEDYMRGDEPDEDHDLTDAFRLSIEALNAWKQFREGTWRPGADNLPGETEE